MKIAIIGATGHVGHRLTDELLSRGHQVTGITRKVESSHGRSGCTLVQGEVHDVSTLVETLHGLDAFVHSVRFVNPDAKKVHSCNAPFRSRATAGSRWSWLARCPARPRAGGRPRLSGGISSRSTG